MNEKLGVTTILALFGLGVSACYLRSYWGAFDIDVFQFAGLTDFAKLAVYPLLLSALGGAIGLFVGTFLFPLTEKQEAKSFSARGMKRLRLAAGASLVLMPTIVLVWSKPWAWCACVFISMPVIFQLCELPVSRRYFKDFTRRFITVTIMVLFPLLAAMVGAFNAEALKTGVVPRIVDNVGVAADLKGTPEHPLMYIGYVNDTFVIYETQTRSVVLLKQVDNAPLVLKPNPKSEKSLGAVLRVLGL